MNKNVAFIMDRRSRGKVPTIALVLPGIDSGNAVEFEATMMDHLEQPELEALLDKVVLALPGVVKLVEEKV